LNDLAYQEGPERFPAEQPVAGASGLGINEDFPLEGARSLSGMTKLAGELMVAEYGDAYGIRYFIDRCGLLTGPWQMAKSDQGVIALWMAAHYFRRNLSYIGFDGSGRQVRDFLHIDDFCNCCWRRSAISKPIGGACSMWAAGRLSACRCWRLRGCAKRSRATVSGLRR
jgi:CDP-paratose 2-epimerase